MAEFKVNDALTGEIAAFKSAREGLSKDNVAVSDEGVSTLKTAGRFIEEHQDIMKLLQLYQRLIVKEASDLDAMVESAKQVDAAIADTLK